MRPPLPKLSGSQPARGGGLGVGESSGVLKIVTHAERPDLRDRWEEVFREVWPELMGHDPICNRYWNGLGDHYPECQVYLIDDQTDEFVGLGNTVPVVWDGTLSGLPGGVDDVLAGRDPRARRPAAADDALRAPGGCPARAIGARV